MKLLKTLKKITKNPRTMNMMKTSKINNTNFINFILLITGICWIIFSLYLIFRDRTLSNKYLIVFFHFMFIIQSIYLFRNNNFILITYMIEKFKYFKNIIYVKPLSTFFEDIFKELPYIGDILIFISKYFVKFYELLGYYRIKLGVIIFFVLPKVILALTIFLNIYFQAQLYIFLIIILVYVRLSSLLFFIMKDFSHHNNVFLRKYLIIKNFKDKVEFYLNLDTIPKNKNNLETLNLYSKWFLLFDETFYNAINTMYFYDKKIKPYLSPFTVSMYFICSTKIILNNFHIPNYVYILLYIIVYIKEYQNIKHETKDK